MKLFANPAMARWLSLSLLVVVLDQATKWLAEALLEPFRPVAPTPAAGSAGSSPALPWS